jgi:PAS domain S-box-containing protein
MLAGDVYRLLEGTANAAFVVTVESEILFWNAAAERLFGYRAEEVVGSPVSILAPAGKGNESADLFARMRRGEPIASYETVRVRRGGELLHVYLTLAPIRVPTGEIQGASVLASDITERRRSEEMLRMAVDAAPNAMIMADASGIIVLVNAQTEKLFGYTREELVGCGVDMLIPKKYRQAHPGYRADFMREPRARAMGAGRDLFGVRKDGSEFPVEIGLNPMKTEQGMRVLSAIVDITERRRSEEMFRIAVDAAPNAMVMVDAGGKIVMVNTQTETLFGYTREELIGSGVEILIPQRYRGAHPAYRLDFMREPLARSMGVGRDLYGVRKDGSEFPVEIGLNPIETERGTLVLSAIIDITQRK